MSPEMLGPLLLLGIDAVGLLVVICAGMAMPVWWWATCVGIAGVCMFAVVAA